MPLISPLSLVRNTDVEGSPLTAEKARAVALEAANAVVRYAEERCDENEQIAFRDVECGVRDLVFGFARAVIVLFLVMREQRTAQEYSPGERLEGGGSTLSPCAGDRAQSRDDVWRHPLLAHLHARDCKD